MAFTDTDIDLAVPTTGQPSRVRLNPILKGLFPKHGGSITGETTLTKNATIVSNADSAWDDDTDKDGVNILRVGDRLFLGDATDHTGNRTGAAGLGTDWVSTRAANYLTKNARGIALSTNRISWLGGSYTPAGASSVTNIGIAAVSLNEGVNSTGRAFYAEYLHKPTGGGGATAGIEIQGGNFTDVMPSPTPYSVGPGAFGLYIGAESAHNYVVGDDDTPVTAPTRPCSAAIDIGGGSIAASYQKFKAGMVFRQNALWRGADDGDGSTGTADAFMLASGHQIKWHAANSVVGAIIRSDHTAIAADFTGLLFANRRVDIVGENEAPIVRFEHIANADNYLQFENATIAPKMRAVGADTNIDLRLESKGSGGLKFYAGTSLVEVLRFDPGTDAPVNGLFIRAAGSTGAPYIAPLGETNVSMEIRGRGTGDIRLAEATGALIALFRHASGADNYLQVENGTADVVLRAVGADTNVGLFAYTKGTGSFRVYGGTAGIEVLRMDPGTATPINGIIMRAAGAGGAPYIAPLGETNVDLDLRGRGTGRIYLNDALRVNTADIPDFADDAAAAAGGVSVGHVYRTGSILKVRVS